MVEHRPVVLGIDQGTRSSKAILVDESGAICRDFRQSVTRRDFRDGRVEQDPEELYQSVRAVIDQARSYARSSGLSIIAAGLAVQRSGVCAWRAGSHESLHPLMTWADSRFASEVEKLEVHRDMVAVRCGMRLSAYYGAPKIAALQRVFPDPSVRIGTLDTYLLQRLCGDAAYRTEHTMASRTMLCALESESWDSELCAIFGVERARLAPVFPTLSPHGNLSGIPLLAMCGDQQASLTALRSGSPQILINLGSILSCGVPTESPKQAPGCLCSVLYSETIGGVPARSFLTEAILNDVAELLDGLARSAVGGNFAGLEAACRRSAAMGSSREAIFRGDCALGTPEWRGAVLSRSVPDSLTGDALLRSSVEHVAFSIGQLLDHLTAHQVSDAQVPVTVGGGLSRFSYLIDCIGTVAGRPCSVVEHAESTALGAARLAWRAHRQGQETVPWRVSCRPAGTVDARLLDRYILWKRIRTEVLSDN